MTANYVLAEEPGKEGTLTEEEFTRPESFEGWDFENTWTLENGTRPTLRAVPEPITVTGRFGAFMSDGTFLFQPEP